METTTKTKFKETKQRLEAIIEKQNVTLNKLKTENEVESLISKHQCIYDLNVQNWRLGYLEALNVFDRSEGLEHFINLINSKLEEEAKLFEERRAIV